MEEKTTIENPTEDVESSNTVVDIKGLKKSFGNKHVLQNINLTLAKGENLVVLGKSGTGKSVLIKCMMRLIQPDEGEIEVLDKNILELKEHELNDMRKCIGFLFQSAALYDSMTVGENLEFPLRGEKDVSVEETNKRVLEALQNVGLEDSIHKMPSELSGGMRKRIGLARTMMLKPQIMLYDEPTTGLDPITSKEISKLILEVQKKYNTSSIIITHDMECARITANRIVILKEGEVAMEGTYEELKKSEDEWVRSFFE
ncbi:MAG: organic solvent transporter ATP-binding protein [Cytophagaceae bacterium]|jgi:phospholipid/cholesterol/gamma-HCH transport system ATP-binding protein|nr:organic solvent transporter ATP-binding protein [Cytophagaceae bacterium]